MGAGESSIRIPGETGLGLDAGVRIGDKEGMNRRQWLACVGAGWVGGCVPFSGGGGGSRWDERTLDLADGMMRKSGCKGWAAWEGGSLRKAWRTHESGPVMSITKSLAMLACVKAAGEGWLSGGDKVSETISEWRGVAGKQDITVLMLLQMTAGLDEGVAALYRARPRDKGVAAVAVPLRDEPGTVFRYGPACWEVLGELLRRKCQARGLGLSGFIDSAVIRPVGLTSGNWKPDGVGERYLSTGAEATVTGLGRLGRTLSELLNGRDAAGFKSGVFRDLTKVSAANPMFGGGLWRNRGGREIEVEESLGEARAAGFWSAAAMSARQPGSMVALIGSAGQRVWVWPERSRVVVRLGYSPSWRDRPFLAVI